MAVSVEARPAPTKATAVSDNRATRSTGPGRGARGQQRHHRLPNFARNLSWSFFDTPQKRCNSNDANSMFEQAAGELRAKLRIERALRHEARPGFETTHKHTSATRPRRCGGRRRARAGFEARRLAAVPVGPAGPGRASRRRAERSSRRGRRAGGPPPTAAQSSPARRVGPEGARNTSGATSNNTGPG